MVDLGERYGDAKFDINQDSVFDSSTGASLYATALSEPEGTVYTLVRGEGSFGNRLPPARVRVEGGGGVERILLCADGNVLVLREPETPEHPFNELMLLAAHDLRLVQTVHVPRRVIRLGGERSSCMLCFKNLLWLDNWPDGEDSNSSRRTASSGRRLGVAGSHFDSPESLNLVIYRYEQLVHLQLESNITVSLHLPSPVVNNVSLKAAEHWHFTCRMGEYPCQLILSYNRFTNGGYNEAIVSAILPTGGMNAKHGTIDDVPRVTVDIHTVWRDIWHEIFADETDASSCEPALRLLHSVMDQTSVHQSGVRQLPRLEIYRTDVPAEYEGSGRPPPLAFWDLPDMSPSDATVYYFLGMAWPSRTKEKKDLWEGTFFSRNVMGPAAWARGMVIVKWSASPIGFWNLPEGEPAPVRRGVARVIVYRFPWCTRVHPLLPPAFRAMVRALLVAYRHRPIISGNHDAPEVCLRDLPYEVLEYVIAAVFDAFLRENNIPTREELLARDTSEVGSLELWPEGNTQEASSCQIM